MTKKSLLITNDFPPIVSGISTAFYHLWKNLPSDKVVVLAPQTEGCEEFDMEQTFTIIRKWIPLGETTVAKLLKSLIVAIYTMFLVFKFKVRKIHCGQLLSGGLAGLLCKKLFGIPYNVYVYGSETTRFSSSKLLTKFINKIIDEAEELVSNSEFTSQEFLQFGISSDKIVKVLPGVDTEVFYPQTKSRQLIEQFKLDGYRVLLTVGRLDERKGNDMVMKSLPKVLESYPDTKYIIVGGGREESAFKNLARDLGLFESVSGDDKINFAGYVAENELPLYYNLCDIYVMPNRETSQGKQLAGDLEGFGIVFLEAGACSKPVIAGRSGGVAESVADGVSGLIVDPCSEKEISNAIIRLIDDQPLAEQFGKAGLKRARLQYDWKLLAKTVLEIL